MEVIKKELSYTSKTTKLSEERKSFDQERKYYENLYADLENVRSNPQLASEFIKTYPEKFHSYLEGVLKNNPREMSSAQPSVAAPIQDVKTLSRLERLEKFYQEQELAKAKSEITEITTQMGQKYNLGEKAKPWIMSLAYEAYNENGGQKLTNESWQKIYERVDGAVNDIVKERYEKMVKEQSTANSKARDVESGGGTPGSAPRKFKNFEEITKFAVENFKGV